MERPRSCPEPYEFDYENELYDQAREAGNRRDGAIGNLPDNTSTIRSLGLSTSSFNSLPSLYFAKGDKLNDSATMSGKWVKIPNLNRENR